jgi:UDPglucose 6-dehydrogenase
MKNISVIGLGKLGGTMAACFASSGFNVIGVDINPEVIDALNNGKAPAQEKGLSQLVSENKKKIRATDDINDAINNSDISFVIVPTPSDEDGKFSLEYAKNAFKEIGLALRKKNNYHTVVMTSTVLPGSMRFGLLPILEEYSKKKCGNDFGLCYNPEFIALGSVIYDFLNPDFYLLGQFDEKSGDMLQKVHNQVSKNNAPVKRMSIENAELAKISLNSFVTLKISFANMMAEFCEKIPGGNVDIISDALGMDKRIGRSYLTGGFGFGGPCFPRDNVALSYIAKELNVDSSILVANDKYNKSLPLRQILNFKEHLPIDATIGVLGLAYKPLTHVTEESSGVNLCNTLVEDGYKVVGHDSLAIDDAKKALNPMVKLSNSLTKVLQECDVIIVTIASEEYKKMSVEQILMGKEKVVVIDIWRILPHLDLESRIKYIPIGVNLKNNLNSQHLINIYNIP